MSDSRRGCVATMLEARSVALVGASAKPGSFGERMIIEARRSSARMHLVNPRYERIDGVTCAPSLAALDEPVDLVLLGVPDTALLAELNNAAAVGVKSAVIFGSAHGAPLRRAVAQAATDAGMAVCGAGCMGFVNNVTGLRALGYLETDPLPSGGVSLVTHSGSAFSTILRASRGFGFRVAISSGQELVTDTADYLDYIVEDPGTTMIALLLETPRSVGRLRAGLRRAAQRDIPVVILPVGHSPRGRAMVAAHSGALAGDAAGWQAFCADTGAIRVTDMAEFVDTIELFEAGRRRRPGSRGIATVHDSGAERALCADLAHELAVDFAELATPTLRTLAELLDDGLSPGNPLDVWGTGADTRALFSGCLRALVDDPGVAVTALAVDLVTEFDDDTAYPDAMLDVAAGTHAPLAVLASVPSAVDGATAAGLRHNGIPVLEGARSGIAALGHLARWPLPVSTALPHIDAQRAQRWTAELTAAEWNAPAAFRLMADYGIPVTRSYSAHTVAEVLAAADAVGYPVVLKTLGAAHKSDVGGVVLGIGDRESLGVAYEEMAERLGSDVSVDAMAPAGVEISLGVVRDDNFGPMIVVAAGGTLVELLADRAVACPPISRDTARELVQSLRSAPLLMGWRGAPAADVDALADAIVGFSQLAIELGEHLDAVEANPVIVSATGVVAVDALVIPRAR
ncbi:acetate--CoA ligase family protein [Mycolicibacterium aichiense]|uniref:Acetyl-CoA synthetase n=1 Tax=Mycolicibacterium aichiense TaxID=1799 RepID=A0AAD1HQ36_9MYCO|nr:acetate--CoA ligase family protein [Mycolicibacterium aichiense]MCV7016579.1 acetate--CoA ligase family protein [Mycolicibacterium aichiense]BBX09643.1 acetyl-CoA synthetase [Mycolicibacterium aichiense]SUA14207.1 acetyl-CoA synthetase, putative [Mycolicibacterium aichiense]